MPSGPGGALARIRALEAAGKIEETPGQWEAADCYSTKRGTTCLRMPAGRLWPGPGGSAASPLIKTRHLRVHEQGPDEAVAISSRTPNW